MNKIQKNTIYIDMDGVVADFDGYAEQTLGHKHNSTHWPPDQWQQLTTIPHLYKNLPKTKQADNIMALARQFRDQLDWDLFMLTAIPKDNDVPDAFQDKILWMQEHYPDIPVRFGPYSKDKHKHCKSGDILVDDRQDNCDQWHSAGGIAIRAKNRDEALYNLQKTFETARSAYKQENFLPMIKYLLNDLL